MLWGQRSVFVPEDQGLRSLPSDQNFQDFPKKDKIITNSVQPYLKMRQKHETFTERKRDIVTVRLLSCLKLGDIPGVQGVQ